MYIDDESNGRVMTCCYITSAQEIHLSRRRHHMTNDERHYIAAGYGVR